ncbi:SMC-Scp complex subunit ScpB [bacterium]|nr:SMC-Scp complex subunit ScpB [candidate division CSSED10-310 bacterium]
MDDQLFFAICEALIFASPEPVKLDTVKSAFEDALPDDFEMRFERFLRSYNAQRWGTQIIEVAGGYQIVTRSQFAPHVKRLKTVQRQTRLTRAACETLAIIAYQQPVTQPEIEHIRGVDSAGVVRNLLEKGLITILGKKHAPGNPILYGTTKKFLAEFGLKELTALPDLKEFDQILNPAPDEEAENRNPDEEIEN